MSLQAKFASLLGTIALTVTLVLIVCVVALNFMHNEVRRPFQIMSSALIELQAVKYAVEAQRDVLLRDGAAVPGDDGGQGTQGDLAMFDANAATISGAMRRLVENERIVTATGKTSLSNLRTRLADARDLSERWFAQRLVPDREAAAQELHNAFLLTRRIESRIIADTNNLLIYARDQRQKVLGIIGFVALTTLLEGVLGFMLVRRWVVRPVAELRAATARIAAGDFAHRIPVLGGDELASLSTEVNSMASMVKALQDEAVDRERLAAVGEVVQRIAHNLRSPLAGIRGLAELSRTELDSAGVDPSLREDVGENQSRIIAAVDRFEGWLRDLLDATRPLEIVRRTVDPREWLARVVQAYVPLAKSRQVQLVVDVDGAPSAASFDPRHLEHALGAMIANALDAVAGVGGAADSPAPTVKVLCRLLPPTPIPPGGGTGQNWELRVEDNGPGVPPDLRERIFKPYFTTKREGTGIGLALAQQIIRAHGGGLRLLASSHEDTRNEKPSSMAHSGVETNGLEHREGRETHGGAVFSAWMPIGPIEGSSTEVATVGHAEVASGQNSRH